MTRFFAWPWASALVVLLPLAGYSVTRIERRWRARRLGRLATAPMVARLAPRQLARGPWRTVRLVTALAFGGLALAGPRWGVDRSAARQTGIDVAIVADASLSMTAADVAPSRLEEMKAVVRRLRTRADAAGERHEHDGRTNRFALVAFAGRSYLLEPLTTDAEALDLYVTNLEPATVGVAGTSLARALDRAVVALREGRTGPGDDADAPGQDAGQAIVLLTDGEGFDPVPAVTAAIRRAADAGIYVITVGFGTRLGTTIPVRDSLGQLQTKTDRAGAVVVTRYMPDVLAAVAREAGGVFVPAETPDKVGAVWQALRHVRPRARATATGEGLALWFQWFVFPMFVLLVLDTLYQLRSRRRRVVTTAAAITTAMAAAACHTPPPRHGERAAAERRYVISYNAGTQLLRRGSLLAARPHLDSALGAAIPGVRFRAAFNSGLAILATALRTRQAFDARRHAGRAMGGSSDDDTLRGAGASPRTQSAADSAEAALGALFDSTLARYHIALVINPNDRDAKWNYELAYQHLKGGRSGRNGKQSSAAPEPTPDPQRNAQQITLQPQQAEALLEAAAEQERLAAKAIPAPPPTLAEEHDW